MDESATDFLKKSGLFLKHNLNLVFVIPNSVIQLPSLNTVIRYIIAWYITDLRWIPGKDGACKLEFLPL